ncbi:hypothetical protein CcCBS67573_g07802 [Chytriomyces confervae]|uniref:Nephrocystin 3-like N-terminal domain-containing protein n=1 Tax=Chytriomyces confervae TaxID=246404 RepID=A0A507ERQ7_9FUNG|nr:hypothetical protein CcCBS67573_g07802 [Chytriomyces confervae]
MGQCHSKGLQRCLTQTSLTALLSTAAKRPARALSPVRGLNRNGIDHPIKNANLDSKKATAVHVPIVEAENAVNEPVNKDPPVRVTQYVQSQPPADIAKAVEDMADVPAKKGSSPRFELKFPEGTLGTEIQSKPLEDLAKAFEAMIAKIAKSTGSGVDIDHIIDQINSITVNVSEFSAKAQAFLAAAPNVSSEVNETIDHVMATIDDIASAHPILKISWFIVSAGYKMISDASKVNQEYLELPGQFRDILEYVSHFLNLPVQGIADVKERSNLVKASESIIVCLTDAAILFTTYMDTPGTTWSNIAGSNKNKLDEMKVRLTDVQEAHNIAKAKVSFTVLVTTASIVEGIKSVGQDTNAVVYGIQSDTRDIKAALQAQSTKDSEKEKKDELEKLLQLCQKRDPHRGEVATLVDRCALGTRKWIVDHVLESIEKGEEKITWLRCEAGTGKSVIAGRVAQELEQKGLLGATFFCKFNNDERNNIAGLIQTIAFELAEFNDPFRTALIRKLESVNKNKKDMPEIEMLLHKFIKEPMKAWPDTTPAVVVIDALDEIKDTPENINLLLGAFLHRSSVKLFITSRPEIKAMEESSISFIAFDQMAQDNLEDLRMFAGVRLNTLFANFPEFGLGDREKLREMLVEKSTGLFIWITLVLGNVNDLNVHKIKMTNVKAHVRENKKKLPETSKELIKRLEASASLSLHALYCRALSEAFLDGDETKKEHQLELFKASVGTLMTIKAPMSKDQLPYLVVRANNPMFDEIVDSLDNISALLRADERMKLSFIHKTVQDYLIGTALSQDKSRCDNFGSIRDQLSMDDEKKLASIDKTVSDYCEGIASWSVNSHECVNDISFKLDFGEISFNLAITCLDLLNSDLLTKNMAKLDGCVNYSDGNSKKWIIDDEIMTERLQYAILYWSDHFVDVFTKVDAHKQDQLLSELKRFCKTQLLYYLEAILLLQKLDIVGKVANSMITCLNDNSSAEVAFIRSILWDLKLVSANFSPQLTMSPLQVYNHALIAVPQNTEYYRVYHKFAPARIAVDAQQSWEFMTLFGHSKPVTSVAVSPDSTTIISGSKDQTLKLWDVQTGECQATLEGHKNDVNAVAITPDGKLIISGSSDETIKVWNLETKTCIATMEPWRAEVEMKKDGGTVHSVAITPDGKTIIAGLKDEIIQMWDIATRKWICTLQGHTESVTSVAITPDGKTIISGSEDNTVKVWNSETKLCDETLESEDLRVFSVATTPDSKSIVYGSECGAIMLWDIQTEESKAIPEGHTDRVVSVAVTPDGKTIVSTSHDWTVKMWDIQTQTCNATTQGGIGKPQSVAVTPDGKTVVFGSDDHTVKIWYTQMGAEKEKPKMGFFTPLNMTADGKNAIADDGKGNILVFDTQTGEHNVIRDDVYHSCAAITPDCKTIVCAADDKVKVWDKVKESDKVKELYDWTCKATFEGHSTDVYLVAITPDGKTIVSVSYDEVKVWDSQTESCKATLEGKGYISSVSITPDGKISINPGYGAATEMYWDHEKSDDWLAEIPDEAGMQKNTSLAVRDGWLVSTEGQLLLQYKSNWIFASNVAVCYSGNGLMTVMA